MLPNAKLLIPLIIAYLGVHSLEMSVNEPIVAPEGCECSAS